MEIEIKKRVKEFYAARSRQQWYSIGELSLVERKAFDHFEKGKVLDVCCGAGRHVFPLAKKGLDVVGLDYVPEMIKEAKQKARGFDLGLETSFIVGDAECLPFRDGVFDYVMCLGSLQCFPTPLQRGKVLLENARVLKGRGSFFAETSHLLYPEKYGLRWLGYIVLFLIKLPKRFWKNIKGQEKIGLSFGDVYLKSEKRSPFLHSFSKGELRKAMEATGMRYRVFTSDEFLGKRGFKAKLSPDLVIVGDKSINKPS